MMCGGAAGIAIREYIVLKWVACILSAALANAGNTFADTILADSVSQFSGVQGNYGWYYGYYDKTNDADHVYDPAVDFRLMGQYRANHALSGLGTGPAWCVEDGKYFTSLWAEGGHPNGIVTSSPATAVEHFAIRRWVSNAAGPVMISGHLAKLVGSLSSNGIAGRVYLDGVHKYAHSIDGSDRNGVNYSLAAYLTAGTKVDFMLDSWRAHDWSDSTVFTARITAVPEPSPLLLCVTGVALLLCRRTALAFTRK